MSFAVIRLNLSVSEFWRLLPKEYFAISEEYSRKTKEEMDLTLALQEIADWRMSMICCVTANAHRSKGKAFKPSDFMPDRKVKPKGVKMTTDEMKDVLKTITIQMGGEVRI